MSEFLAQTLNSRQLLALLYICECKRKGLPLDVSVMKQHRPSEWEEVLDVFADRFGNSSETTRFEVLEAHLMSVEDLDVYNNDTLKTLIDENHGVLEFLSQGLTTDPRFQL